uniref:Uncharacterized protein n=1 Tax=Arundo donax TaxID=35708 RepID=A0A0A9H5D9_ARUDO
MDGVNQNCSALIYFLINIHFDEGRDEMF